MIVVYGVVDVVVALVAIMVEDAVECGSSGVGVRVIVDVGVVYINIYIYILESACALKRALDSLLLTEKSTIPKPMPNRQHHHVNQDRVPTQQPALRICPLRS